MTWGKEWATLAHRTALNGYECTAGLLLLDGGLGRCMCVHPCDSMATIGDEGTKRLSASRA